MKYQLMTISDKILFRKRALIETIDQLKKISKIEHSRYRDPLNFLVIVLDGKFSEMYHCEDVQPMEQTARSA